MRKDDGVSLVLFLTLSMVVRCSRAASSLPPPSVWLRIPCVRFLALGGGVYPVLLVEMMNEGHRVLDGGTFWV